MSSLVRAPGSPWQGAESDAKAFPRHASCGRSGETVNLSWQLSAMMIPAINSNHNGDTGNDMDLSKNGGLFSQ